jgi:uncharacterized protein (DUF433 family)
VVLIEGQMNMASKAQKPIQKSKSILNSTPTFPGTRVPVKNLIDYLIAGDTVDTFLSDFPTVKKTQVARVLKLIDKNLPKLVA